MTKIEQQNVKIAEFMGYQFCDDAEGDYPDGYWCEKHNSLPMLPEDFNYNDSWNWLMPVVDKLMKTKIGDGVKYVEYPFLRTFGMLNKETKKPMVRLNGFQVFEAETLIEATFLAVVDFIEWYNKQEKRLSD